MKNNWPTKENDMFAAARIMEEYATKQNTNALGFFELVVDEEEKKLDFRLSEWVITLAHYFKAVYGLEQGDFVTRQVLSYCLTRGETIH